MVSTRSPVKFKRHSSATQVLRREEGRLRTCGCFHVTTGCPIRQQRLLVNHRYSSEATCGRPAQQAMQTDLRWILTEVGSFVQSSLQINPGKSIRDVFLKFGRLFKAPCRVRYPRRKQPAPRSNTHKYVRHVLCANHQQLSTTTNQYPQSSTNFQQKHTKGHPRIHKTRNPRLGVQVITRKYPKW